MPLIYIQLTEFYSHSVKAPFLCYSFSLMREIDKKAERFCKHLKCRMILFAQENAFGTPVSNEEIKFF